MEFRFSEVLDGDLLINALENQSIDGVLERSGCAGVPGVYVWLRRLSPKNQSIGTPSDFMAWIRKSVSQTQGEVSDRVRHIGRIRFELGGGSLSDQNLGSLNSMATDHSVLKEFQKMLRQFDYTQALYVGEASDIGRRIKEHVAGQSGFAERLVGYGYEWGEVGVKFAKLPVALSLDQRRAIERALSVWLIAPQTDRAG